MNLTALASHTQPSAGISKVSALKKSQTGCTSVFWSPTTPLRTSSTKVYVLRWRTSDTMFTPVQSKPLSSQRLAGCSTPTNTLICDVSKSLWNQSYSNCIPKTHLSSWVFSLKISGTVPKLPRPPSLPQQGFPPPILLAPRSARLYVPSMWKSPRSTKQRLLPSSTKHYVPRGLRKLQT